MIEGFWARVDLGGRDRADINQFKIGERFSPTGRPGALVLQLLVVPAADVTEYIQARNGSARSPRTTLLSSDRSHRG
jgi:hypothetical protein